MEQWAEVRRMKRVEGLSAREISRRTGLARDTVSRLLAASEPPRYARAPAGSNLDPFKDWICEQLRRCREIHVAAVAGAGEEIGYAGGKSIFDDLRARGPPAVPGEADVSADDLSAGGAGPVRSVGAAQSMFRSVMGSRRRGWVVTCESCWSRAFAGTLIFSKEAPDILAGPGAQPRAARGAGGEAGLGPRVRDRCGAASRPRRLLSFCGQLRGRLDHLGRRRPAGEGAVGALSTGFCETNFEPRRVFANHLDFQDQLDRWTEKANGRLHRTIRAVPAERLARGARAAAAAGADDRRYRPAEVIRVPQQPLIRVDRNDYSIDPAFAGRRVEVRVSQREVTAVVLDTGELAAATSGSSPGIQTIVDPAHQNQLERQRQRRRQRHEVEVEHRPLSRL